jgi:hypothetical protein
VEVIEDTEDTQANPADEGKPRCIIYGWLCIYIQELKWNPRCMIVTLDFRIETRNISYVCQDLVSHIW